MSQTLGVIMALNGTYRAFALVHDSRGHASMTALSSGSPIYDALRLSLVNRRLGEIVLFAQCLHEVFGAAILQRGIAPLSRGTSLSGRER